MKISLFYKYCTIITLLLFCICTHSVSGQKAVVYPLDTEGVNLRDFSTINFELSNKATVEQVQSASFLPIDNEFQWRHSIWLCFVVDNRLKRDTIISLLFNRPTSLIEVFRKDNNRFISLGTTGTRHPSTQATLIYKLTTLQILLRKNQVDTFYLNSFDHVAHVRNLPFPIVYTGSSLPQQALIQHLTYFERERWFYFFLTGFSLVLVIWAFFKSIVNDWDRANLYCGLMFLCNFFNTWLWTRTVNLSMFSVFAEISTVHPIGKWFNNLTPIFMWLLYRTFLNTRVERPFLYRLLTGFIWIFVFLNISHIVFSVQINMHYWTLFIEKAIEKALFTTQFILPFLFLPYWRHPLYRYIALSSWIILLGLGSYLTIFRFGWDDYLPIGLSSVFILFVPFAFDGILFMMALTLRDRQIALQNRELVQQATISELKALRTQMNPHFIFNCLNAIKSYTLNHDTEGADFYLTKFSKLIRQVLENSRSEKITLQNELETLTLYLDMEKLRAGDKLDYEIQIPDDLETDFIEIPPMLIQPYVENAIWHGLMHKETGGKIIVDCRQKDEKYLLVTILDNGIGRDGAAALKSKTATRHKSFGMKITSERMDIIRDMYKIDTTHRIEDLKNADGSAAGTKVSLEIPI